MKLLYTLLAILPLATASAQEARLLKKVRGQLELSEVVVDSLPAQQLYFNAKLFFADAFYGARETSQIKDEKARVAATKGSFPVFISDGEGGDKEAKVVFTLTIQCRENMYRYCFKDFLLSLPQRNGPTSYASFDDHNGISLSAAQWQEVERQTEHFFDSFVVDLKEQMSQTQIPHEETSTSYRKKR
jgi:hypothetical protein